MTPSTHDQYCQHLASHAHRAAGDPLFLTRLALYTSELVTLVALSLDTVRDRLAALYCPTGQGQPYDPICMLRSWLLMTLCKVESPDAWAARLRKESVLAILAGFSPHQTPCATAHRDFLIRYADGPYAIRTQQDATLSDTLHGPQTRRLEDATIARQHDASPYNSQSEAVVTRLLAHAADPRDPHALQTRLENLCADLGLRPTLTSGLFDDQFQAILSGDGTTLASAASPDGKKTCTCPPHSPDCDHPRDYTSATAQWCKDTHHPGWTFGDRSYTISIHVNHHDLPLITLMGTGNESDFTLAPKALDDLLKLLREYDLPICPVMFVGDGHHDAAAIYLYLNDKGLIPIIPLRESSVAAREHGDHPIPATRPADTTPPTATDAAPTTTPTDTTATTPTPLSKAARPHVDRYPHLTFDPDGTPLCPAGCRMRHFNYIPGKFAHHYICPAQHGTRHGYVFHPEECPFRTDCQPEAKMGKMLYIKSTADPRLFPPIPRDSQRFKDLYAERTSVERSNAVEDSYRLDHRHRNAVYGLIRLTFVNICKHATSRWLERRKTHTETILFQETMSRIFQAGPATAPTS